MPPAPSPAGGPSASRAERTKEADAPSQGGGEAAVAAQRQEGQAAAEQREVGQAALPAQAEAVVLCVIA